MYLGNQSNIVSRRRWARFHCPKVFLGYPICLACMYNYAVFGLGFESAEKYEVEKEESSAQCRLQGTRKHFLDWVMFGWTLSCVTIKNIHHLIYLTKVLFLAMVSSDVHKTNCLPVNKSRNAWVILGRHIPQQRHPPNGPCERPKVFNQLAKEDH